jgi:hypothetical protein
MRTLTNHSRREQRGVALLVTIIAIFVMISLSAAWIITSQARAEATNAAILKARVDAMAEAGLSAAIADIVGGGTGNLGVDLTWDPAIHDTGGPGPAGSWWGAQDGHPTFGEPGVALVPFTSDGGYWTRCTEAAADGKAFHVVAGAYQNGTVSLIEAVVEQVELPPFPGAVYLQHPNVVLAFNGNAFTIDGHDFNWDDSAGTRAPLPGVATPWDQQPIIDSIGSGRQDQVMGEGGEPSVGYGPYYDLQKIAHTFRPFADNLMPAGTYTADWGNYATGDFQVTYIDGDFHQSGSGHGAGVLLVDGNMTLSGSFIWHGAIIVLGEVAVVGGGGTKHVYGSVFVGDDVLEVDAGGEASEFTITGTSDIDYSGQSEDACGDMMVYGVAYWAQLR